MHEGTHTYRQEGLWSFHDYINTWTVTRTPAGMAIQRVNRQCLLGLRGHPSVPALYEEGLHKAAGAGALVSLGFCGQAGLGGGLRMPSSPQATWRQEGWRHPWQEAAFTSTRSGMLWGLKLF